MVTWSFVAAILVPPIALACWSRARRAALVTTIALTGAAAFLVSLIVIGDPSHIGAYVPFFLVFGPAIAVPVATITAGSFGRDVRPLDVVFAALLGWGSASSR